MSLNQLILLIINILGGIAVIGSYIIGLNAQSGGANVLWGGVPTGIRPVYFVSMIISAIGYFAFIYFIFFRIEPAEISFAGRFGYSLLFLIFVGILFPSALWMPLTNIYVGNPTSGMWITIRIILIVVGLSSAALLWALLALEPKMQSVPYWLAVAGACYFTFHTLILDGVVWAALFKQEI